MESTRYELWTEFKEKFEYNSQISYFNLVVPTKDTV